LPQQDTSFSWFSGWLLQYKLLNYILVSMFRSKPATYLSSYNQHKYYWLAEKYKLLVKLPVGIVGLVLVV